jgi:hypothetical protein
MAATTNLNVNPATTTPLQATELYWQEAVGKLDQTNNEILLAVDVEKVIGFHGVETIVGRLR